MDKLVNPCEGCKDEQWCLDFIAGDETKRGHIECLEWHIYKAQRDMLRKVVDDLKERAGELHICYHHPHLPCSGCEIHKIANQYEKELNGE